MFKWFWTILSLGAPERDFQMPSGASSPEFTGSFSPDRENISYSFHRVHTITPVRESGLEVFLHKNVLIFLSPHSLGFLLVGSHSKFCFALLNSSCNMFSLSFFSFAFRFENCIACALRLCLIQSRIHLWSGRSHPRPWTSQTGILAVTSLW